MPNLNNTEYTDPQQKLVFTNDKVPEFQNNLRQNIQSFDSNYNTITSISDKVNTLTIFLQKNAHKVFDTNITSHRTKQDRLTCKPKWFNEKCYTAKQEFRIARKRTNRNKNEENRLAFVKSRTKYNRIRPKEKYHHKLNEGQR